MRHKFILILLFLLAVFVTGCIETGLLQEFAGKQVGVYVYSDTEFPGLSSEQPLSNQFITSKLVNYINRWSDVNATAIFPFRLKGMDIQAEFTRTQLFSELMIDNLLVIKILEIQKAVQPSFGKGFKVFFGYDVLIEYQVFGKDAPELIFLGNGVAEVREKVVDSSRFTIHIPDSEALVTDAIIVFLSRQ